eukprot:3938743-Pleurochrysis_carterae.AAC.2
MHARGAERAVLRSRGAREWQCARNHFYFQHSSTRTIRASHPHNAFAVATYFPRDKWLTRYRRLSANMNSHRCELCCIACREIEAVSFPTKRFGHLSQADSIRSEKLYFVCLSRLLPRGLCQHISVLSTNGWLVSWRSNGYGSRRKRKAVQNQPHLKTWIDSLFLSRGSVTYIAHQLAAHSDQKKTPSNVIAVRRAVAFIWTCSIRRDSETSPGSAYPNSLANHPASGGPKSELRQPSKNSQMAAMVARSSEPCASSAQIGRAAAASGHVATKKKREVEINAVAMLPVPTPVGPAASLTISWPPSPESRCASSIPASTEACATSTLPFAPTHRVANELVRAAASPRLPPMQWPQSDATCAAVETHADCCALRPATDHTPWSTRTQKEGVRSATRTVAPNERALAPKLARKEPLCARGGKAKGDEHVSVKLPFVWARSVSGECERKQDASS